MSLLLLGFLIVLAALGFAATGAAATRAREAEEAGREKPSGCPCEDHARNGCPDRRKTR